MPVGFRYRNLVLGIECFRLITFNLSQWSNGEQIRLKSSCSRSFPGKGYCVPSVKNNVCRDRRPNAVIMECFICR